MAILWPVKAIFEERAATVEVDTLTSLDNKKKPIGLNEGQVKPQSNEGQDKPRKRLKIHKQVTSYALDGYFPGIHKHKNILRFFCLANYF